MYYKDMEVWKESMNLVLKIYELTEIFPKTEIYGLTNQMRRCAVSIPSNIAEGSVKHSDKESLRFLDISLGSLAELDTQIQIAIKLGYIDAAEKFEQVSKVRALLTGLMKFYEKNVNT